MERNCCFLGHRKIEITNELREFLFCTIKRLIEEENIDTFLFGSKSQFNDLCYETVSELRKNHPYIKRIYVRAQFPYINSDYLSYLTERYEETYFPNNILKAGKSSYVERNYEMINKSKFCIFYLNDNYSPPKRKKSNKDITHYQPRSGTKIAYDYALKKHKAIINVFENGLDTNS